MDILVYIPYKTDPGKASASQLRPMEMLKAFKKIGNTIFINGSLRERFTTLCAVKKMIRQGRKFDFIYAESSTSPTSLIRIKGIPFLNLYDGFFFLLCHRYKIPIGLFYRDIYWNPRAYRFEDRKHQFLIALYSFFYRLDLLFYKRSVTHVFLPSVRMLPFIPYIGALPHSGLPSGLEKASMLGTPIRRPVNDGLTIAYVGGIDSTLYDLRMPFEYVKKHEGLRLLACFREKEWADCSADYAEYLCDRIEIVHYQGAELETLYERADIACLFLKPVTYREFAMPFKLFEYIGHGLPVLAVEGTAAGDFVHENGAGWALPYDENALDELLQGLRLEPTRIEAVRAHMAEIAEANTWGARARQVAATLAPL